MITKLIKLLVCLGLCFNLGCQKPEEQVLDTSYHVTATKLIDQKDLFVQHVIVEAMGERIVQVEAEGQLFRRGIVRPDPDTNKLRYELLFVATLIKSSDSTNTIKWSIQGKDPISTAYHPATFEVEARKLSDVLKMEISDASHLYKQELVLGELLKDPIVLLVE
jgi:hypothetical protein